MAALNDLKKFLEKPTEFGIVPFWFLNHYPEEKIIKQQLADMASQGVSGVMVHARNGLMGGYLDQHWQDIFSCIISEAKKHRLKVWLYDELNFPSGSAGRKVFEACPQNVMQSLELVYEQKEVPDGTFDKLIRFRDMYLGFKIQKQPQYPDYLNDEVTTEFVRLSYRWYAERFKDDFGSLIPGEFTDNACANFGFYRRSIPWTEKMEEKFFDSCGIQLDEILPSLFFQTEKSTLYRLLFWRFLSHLFLNNFVIKIEQECQRNNIAATGHYCLEHGLSEHVRQIGDRFELKRHQQLPGVDMVGRGDRRVLGNFPIHTPSIMLALTTSPAYFFHGSRVLCESFGLTLHWMMNAAELRRMTGSLAALGIDLFVPHGFYYSISGHRKRECIPDFYHNTMWDQLGEWSLFTARLSALCAHSRHIADTALFYPVTSQQAGIELKSGSSVMDHGERCNRIDAAMMKTGDRLVQHLLPFEAINDRLLLAADIKDGELLIPLPDGSHHPLKTLILPSVWLLEEASFRKLADFARSGGRIIAVGETLSQIFTGKEIREVQYGKDFYAAIFADFPEKTDSDQAFVTAVREGVEYSRIQVANHNCKLILREWIRPDGQYFALLHNTSREKITGVEISCRFSPVILDPDDLSFTRIRQNTFKKDFDYGESLILTESSEELPVHTSSPAPQSVWTPEIKHWHIRLLGPNAMHLDQITCRYHGIERSFISEFTIKDLPDSLGIALDIDPTEAEAAAGYHPFFENGSVFPRNRCVVRVNGQKIPDIQFGRSFDHWIYEGNILPFVQLGNNTVEIIQHCAYFETNNTVPEPVMLTGNFGFRDDALVPAPETLDDPRWDKTELKHYSGAMTYTAVLPVPPQFRGKIYSLQLENVYETAEVRINDVFCGSRIMPPWNFSIDPDLTTGETLTLQLKIRNTPANRWEEPIASGFDGTVRFLIR